MQCCFGGTNAMLVLWVRRPEHSIDLTSWIRQGLRFCLSFFSIKSVARRPVFYTGLLTLSAVLAAVTAEVQQVAAQDIPKSLRPTGTEEAIRATKNNWTVGVVGGLIDGTYMRFAVELASALDDGDNLRILPIVSFGAASNLDDLLYLRGIDVAVTQSDVFEYFRTVRKIANLDRQINYIIRLPVSEVHLLARDDIHSIEDLRGKKVNLGPNGSASSLTGAIIFQRTGIQIQQSNINEATAFEKLKSGELSALVRVVGKPVEEHKQIT